MRVVDDFNEMPAFERLDPVDGRAPFVFNAPHSGTTYPKTLLQRSRLDRQTIRRSEDAFVDTLFEPVTTFGAPLLKANFPRVYVDLNRAEGELDPKMFDGPLGRPVASDSPRVAGGLGLIAKIVGERQEIYLGPLPAGEAEERITRFYRPYHNALAALIAETVDLFGTCVLVDCHSMPSGAIKAATHADGARPDIILGDRFGTSCGAGLIESFQEAFTAEGFVVGCNRPYAGGFITEHYGRPPIVHALQLEINRALYMDETELTKTADYAAFQARIAKVCQKVINAFPGGAQTGRWPLAAE